MKSPGTGDDTPPPAADAPNVTQDGVQPDGSPPPPVDAPPPPPVDAPPAVDAPPPVDAPPQLFCSQNSQCTTPGECCVTLGGPMGFCGPGKVILGQCVPN